MNGYIQEIEREERRHQRQKNDTAPLDGLTGQLNRVACKEHIAHDDYPAEEDNPECRLNGRHLYLELFGIDDVDSEKKRRAQDEQDTRYAQRLLSVAPIEKPYSADSKRKRNHSNGGDMLAIEDDHQQGGHNGIREKYGRGDAGVHKKEAGKEQNRREGKHRT